MGRHNVPIFIDMDANSDEATRCVSLATGALKAGDVEKCVRLLNKADRMYPGLPAAVALRGKLPAPKREATEGMLRAVATVQGSGDDYYKILGVTKGATESELKKAYRKKLLAVHPDKNVAPGAEEAFKKITAAWETLSEPAKRTRYDTYGITEDMNNMNNVPTMRRARRTNGNHVYHGNHGNHPFFNTADGEVDLDEIFNMMFANNGGAGIHFGHQPGQRRANFRTRQRRRREEQAQLEVMNPLQAFLWIFGILGTFSMFSLFMNILSALVNGG